VFRKPLNKPGLAALAASACLAVSAHAQEPTYGLTLTADQPASVTLSNRDVNRIVCLNGAMGQARYSAEKGITTDTSDNELFVKFMIQQLGAQKRYVTDRSEFFITCGGETFTLYGTPRELPSQTIFLRPRLQNAAATQAEFAPLSQEDRAVKITRAVITESYPESFRQRAVDKRQVYSPFPGVGARLERAFDIDGLPLSAEEYVVSTSTQVRLDERMFLKPAFGSGIHAVTIEAPDLHAGGFTRVVIIKHSRRPQ
jgi:hypothetical protein